MRMMSGRLRPRPNLRNGKIRKHGQSSPGLNPSASTVKIDTSGFGNKKREPQWQCVKNCGACCKLDKGPTFPSPEEVFDDESDVEVSFYFFSIWSEFYPLFCSIIHVHGFLFQHYRSLIGPDGWCIHFDKAERKCSIYAGWISLFVIRLF